jgi:hypothetical protein
MVNEDIGVEKELESVDISFHWGMAFQDNIDEALHFAWSAYLF